MKYNKVKFARQETPQEDGTTIVSFSRTGEAVKAVNLTAEQVAALNAGRLTNPGNLVFEYYLAEGEEDPADIILRTTSSGGGGGPFRESRRRGPHVPLKGSGKSPFYSGIFKP
ncbi:MAG: hypothetical protein HYZ15_13040 [Sphingobacteriales bacterium]|nr:hypothetical protein [Sphingobacteriales bacterium]